MLLRDISAIPAIADLRVLASLDAVSAALVSGDAVLQAPPGAGKSTVVPLALLQAPWTMNRRILMLEPRRIAARSVAHRMAALLGEPVGETVGYRMRLETRVSPRTRVEVVTEGVLARLLQSDPGLTDTALVIFDEFHERNLDADLALALVLGGRTLFRDQDPLRVLVMSATLEVDAVAALLGNAPVVRSEGRQYPVDVRYGAAVRPNERLDERVVAAVLEALRAHPRSSLLVFLPGQGEIRRVADALQGRVGDAALRPLYGALDLAEQRQAIEPALGRKVVLATNLAETSLTIEGVDVVIDTGLARQPAFDPRTAMTRLELRRIARDAADQRAGRAGRMAPGVCYRLWSGQQQAQLAPRTEPEILAADLAGVALQLLAWGAADPAELPWLDSPPRGAWLQALDLLEALGALRQETSGPVLTAAGEMMAGLGTHPRLARLLLEGARSGAPARACQLAAILEERDPFGRDNADLEHRLGIVEGATACPAQARGWLARVRRSAEQHRSRLDRLAAPLAQPPAAERRVAPGQLVAAAWPDRVARRRHSGGYQLAHGRSASLAGVQSLGRESWLAVAEVGGAARQQGDVIGLAAALDPALFDGPLAGLVRDTTVTEWERGGDRFIAEHHRRIGALVLARKRLEPFPDSLRERALLDAVAAGGLKLLGWGTAARALRDRVALLRRALPDDGWPDVSEPALLASLDQWLAPRLTGVRRLGELRAVDTAACLVALLSWSQREALEQLAPKAVEVPSGSRASVDYTVDPPVLAVKLQELFGCTETPRIVGGRVALQIHLLSPAGRPLQITQDLATFWRDVYPEVRKEMRGRYSKHPWPEDPLTAPPTRHLKTRPAR